MIWYTLYLQCVCMLSEIKLHILLTNILNRLTYNLFFLTKLLDYTSAKNILQCLAIVKKFYLDDVFERLSYCWKQWFTDTFSHSFLHSKHIFLPSVSLRLFPMSLHAGSLTKVINPVFSFIAIFLNTILAQSMETLLTSHYHNLWPKQHL